MFINENSSDIIEKLTPQEKVQRCFGLNAARAQRVLSVFKITSKFVLTQVAEPWYQPGKLFYTNLLMNVEDFIFTSSNKISRALRKLLQDRQLRLLGSSLFHSLMTYGKKEFWKYSVLQ